MIDLNKQIKDEQERWSKVEAAFATGDLEMFYREYLQYLEKRQAYSKSALFIKETVRATITYIENMRNK